MPPIRIQAHAELKIPIILNRCIDVILLQDLGAVEPQFVVSGPVRLPAGLDLDLVPDPRGDGGKVREGLDVLSADGALLDAGVELVAKEPHHARRHEVVAARVGEVGDELRDVVGLGRGELPIVLQAEGKAVEARVAALVDVVLDHFGMIAAAIAGVVDLGHFESGRAFVNDIGHLLHGSRVLCIDGVPAAEGSGVAELLCSLGC